MNTSQRRAATARQYEATDPRTNTLKYPSAILHQHLHALCACYSATTVRPGYTVQVLGTRYGYGARGASVARAHVHNFRISDWIRVTCRAGNRRAIAVG